MPPKIIINYLHTIDLKAKVTYYLNYTKKSQEMEPT